MRRDNILELTIGIPTFNGASTICGSVESCLESIRYSGLTAIEILIVDNSSIDDTYQKVLKYVESYPKIVRLIKNEENIGLDRNIDKVIELSRGRYVKLLGDDDVVSQDFISSVIQTIKNNHFDVLLSNFLPFDQRNSHESQDHFDVEKYLNNLNILKDSNGIAGQIASITFNRESYLAIDAESAQGTNHKFLFTLVILIARGISLLDFKPKIYVRPGSPRFTSSPMDSLKMQQNALRAYNALLAKEEFWSEDEKKFLLNSIKSQQKYSLTFMDFIHRYTDLNSLQVLQRFYPMGKSLPSFYIKYLPIIFVPKLFGNFLARKIKK
jgi:glycosyltransferase involved in cell wall biosynthesis